MLSLRHCDNVFLFVFYQVKFHFRSLGAVLFLTFLVFVSLSPSFSSWNHFAVWMAWPHTTPLRNGCSLGKADQGKLCHRNLFRHPRPEPINTVLDTRFGEGPLIHVKHLTCVVTGPPSRSEGGRTWPLFLLAAVCVPEGRWPSGDTRNGEAPWESRRHMWFGGGHPWKHISSRFCYRSQ